MLEIEKLSEKILYRVICELFPFNIRDIIPQKRIKIDLKLFIIDYYLEIDNDKFVFEFDGPTHFCNTKTLCLRCLVIYEFNTSRLSPEMLFFF